MDTEKQSHYTPSRLAGLKPFQPGRSGNPGGIKKGTVFVSECYKRLGAMPTDELRNYRPKNAIEDGVKAALLRAIEAPDWQAAHAALKELTDRLEGKAVKVVESVDVQRLEISILVQLRALACIDGKEMSHAEALAELAMTREKLERAQEMGLLEAIGAEYER